MTPQYPRLRWPVRSLASKFARNSPVLPNGQQVPKQKAPRLLAGLLLQYPSTSPLRGYVQGERFWISGELSVRLFWTLERAELIRRKAADNAVVDPSPRSGDG
jgi:hypothetical protein